MNEPTHFWGIDVSSRYMAFAVVSAKHRQANRVSLEADLRGAERLHSARQRTYDFARALAVHFPPFLVYVERPTGYRNKTPEVLTMLAGVAQEAIYDALRDVFPHPVGVHLVAVSDWKKRAVGFGNADKAQVLAWAKKKGYRGDSEDEADALAIATCAYLDVTDAVQKGSSIVRQAA